MSSDRIQEAASRLCEYLGCLPFDLNVMMPEPVRADWYDENGFPDVAAWLRGLQSPPGPHSGCGKNGCGTEVIEPHLCPFGSEIHGRSDTCRCCDDCAYECAMDI